MTTRILDYGDRALLIECGSTGEVLALEAELRRAHLDAVVDIVPGARTVLVSIAEPRQQAPVRALLADLPVPQPGSNPSGAADTVIDVVYDGQDLAEVCDLFLPSVIHYQHKIVGVSVL